jgi:hypothetical protein
MPSKSQLKKYSSSLFLNSLTYTPIDFYAQTSKIRGQLTNFTVSMPPSISNSLLAILENVMEPEKWTNRNRV